MEEKFEKHRDFLVHRIDPNFGLLDKLRAKKILTKEEVEEIKLNVNTTGRKNRILLDFILKSKKFDELLSALRDSGQNHVVNYFNDDGSDRHAYGDDWPLSESDISIMENNYETLVNILDTSELCIKLYSERVLSDRQRQFISSKLTSADKNDALLEILQKCSIRQYNTTIACLSDCKQDHIAKLLSDGGVFVRVHASLENTFGNEDTLENEILTRLTKDLENYPFDIATRVLERIQERYRIVAVRKGQSIVIYIYCTTHDVLLQLIDQLKTAKLKKIIETIFTEMVPNGDALMVTLSWSLEEFRKAAAHLDSDYVSLNDNLLSNLTFTDGQPRSTAMIDDSQQEVCIRESANTPKPVDNIGGCDASTQTDEESFTARKTEECSVQMGKGSSWSLSRGKKLPQLEKLMLTYRSSTFSSAASQITNDSGFSEWSRGSLSAQRPEDRKAAGYHLNLPAHTNKGARGRFYDIYEYVNKHGRSVERTVHSMQALPQDRQKLSIPDLTDRRTECLALKQKLEQTVKENEELKKELAHQMYTCRDILKNCFDMKRTLEEIQKGEDAQIRLLEHQSGVGLLTEKYNSDPILVEIIVTKAAEKRQNVRGMTILDKELFVVSSCSSEVEVYDSVEFSFSRRWILEELFRPEDIGSCNTNKCLYIIDIKGVGLLKEILKVDPNGNLLKNWSTSTEYGSGMSVTDESNVIVVAQWKNKLYEYSPDGELIREINLSSDPCTCHPTHAIKLTNGHFVVSHGAIVGDLHGVCIVDADGNLKKSFGGKTGSTFGQINHPVYLSVDRNGFVMVAESNNSRVLLLDSALEFRKEVISKHRIRIPRRILLDESNGRLFVTESEGNEGRILIFQF